MIENIFIGLQPYTEADAYRFKGRIDESQELYRLIVRNDYTVCYAESGEGKTSLLNAGVFPLLRQNMYFPINIIFTSDDYGSTPESFTAIIDRCIKDSIVEYNSKNEGANIEYKLYSTDFKNLDCQAELDKELSRYSWWSLRNYKPQAMGLTFTPVFIFDQFEEVFSLPESIVWTKKFFDWLEELSSDSCPDEIVKKVRSIIGDKSAFPIIKEEKDFKIVFSLRKEYIGELDYWGMQKNFIPGLKNNRYCLKALTYEGAQKVMIQQERFEEIKAKQVLDFFVRKYSREPEKTIIENLPVIPAHLLSVVCSSWENDIDFFKGKDKIEESLNIILERFYNETLLAVSNTLVQKDPDSQVESIREELETIIFALVDSNGKRVRRKSSELSNLDFDLKYKNILSQNRIIKISKINAEDYVELVHDALCPVIVVKKEHRRLAEMRRREKEKRRKINYDRFLSRQNPLTIGGRQIWDNKTFSFSIDNSRSTSLNNSSNRTEVLKDLLQQKGIDDGGVEQLFFDKLFRQTVDSGKISLSFNANCSKDGISAFEIETERLSRASQQLKIKKIIFKDSNNNDFYTVDGFCGIVFEYDSITGNESKREYICNGYTSLGIAIISFDSYNEYGFPTKVSYFDAQGNPCKHIDGNYGVEIVYDEFGNEIHRWFLNQYGAKTPIYNGVYGLSCQYDESDRIIKQFFIGSDGERVFDIYGFHGIECQYNEPSNRVLASETIYIDEHDIRCNNPYGFCIEQLQYDNKGRVIWQLYLDKDGNEVEKRDGFYSYSKLKIGYNELDKPDNLAMYNLSDNIFKVIRYSYSSNGSVGESAFYETKKSKNGQIEKPSRSDDNAVHKIKYIHDKHGVLVCQEYLDDEGNPLNDKNGYSKIHFLYNDSGVLVESSFYNLHKSETEPIEKVCYRQIDENVSEVSYIEYEIKTIYSTSRKVFGAYRKKQERHVAEVKKVKTYKGLLNHRYEFVKIYCDENNDYIPKTSLTVRRKYDIDGNIVEELLYNINDESPICDESGAYGWRVIDNKIEYLGKNAEIANNEYGYAIVEYSTAEYEGESYSVTTYYDKDCKPTVNRKEGYHKKIESTDSLYDDLCKQIYYYDSKKEQCDCVDGYARQLFEAETINEDEVKIIVSFWGADDTPRINKGLGFHQREQIISRSTGNDLIEIHRSFKDENGILINGHEGFAKKTCKRYDSIWTLFYYPFTDYKVICFYDENDKKVDIDFAVNGKNYHAYKFVVSLDVSTSFKVASSDGKTLYLNHSLLWKFINIIWIPLVLALVFMVSPLYLLYQRLSRLCRSKYESVPESATIIRITEIFESVQNGERFMQAPIRQYDVEEGSWIVKWNNWLYDPNQDVATTFEAEFNNSSEQKSITFYNPSKKEFLDVEITNSNIGIRIQDAQVPTNEVKGMLFKWKEETSCKEN